MCWAASKTGGSHCWWRWDSRARMGCSRPCPWAPGCTSRAFQLMMRAGCSPPHSPHALLVRLVWRHSPPCLAPLPTMLPGHPLCLLPMLSSARIHCESSETDLQTFGVDFFGFPAFGLCCLGHCLLYVQCPCCLLWFICKQGRASLYRFVIVPTVQILVVA